MDARIPRFSRFLLAVMVLLYGVSLAAFTAANLRADPNPVAWQIVVNDLILSIPLVLFFGAIFVLARAWYERRISGSASDRLASVIHWAPRIAAILIIFFTSLFSLDVFGTGASFLETLGAFVIHNTPSIAMIVVLVFAWRQPIVGAVAFVLVSLVFLRFVLGGGGVGHFMLFSGPLLLIAALFYTDWRRSKAQPPTPLEDAA
ncbi:MAG: hypothetical protein MUF84_20790 [Anaerolineae bacterium]|nr:hypothetical protein [Anaerolineae bacterium]